MKRIISLLLCFVLLIGALPVSVLASSEPEEGDRAESWRYSGGVFTGGDAPLLNGDAYHPDATLQGIDVSAWQGQIDWEKVKAAGIDFAIIRCGYGMDQVDQDDQYFEYNASECERVGIPYGVYIYSYADTVERAQSEADHVLRLIEGHSLSFPVYFDMEDSSTLDGDLAAIATAFCNKISEAGYPVGVYSNLWWWTTYLTAPCFDNWHRWMAQYNTSCSYTGEYAMWQYSSSGTVDGISGPVDMNYLIGYPSDHCTDASITLATDKTTYAYGEPILVTTNYAAEGAWVGLYKRGERYGETGAKPIFWYALSEETSPVDILSTRDENGRAGDYLAGSYTIVLFADSGHTALRTARIEVTKTVASEDTVPATCTEAGIVTIIYTDGTTETTILPATGHSWDEGTVSKKPTATEDGEMLYTCTVCGGTYTQIISRLPSGEVIRLSGSDRFDTAIKVAGELKARMGTEKFDAILLASGLNFADALGGSYLAAVKNAPILLSHTDEFNRRTAEYIRANLAPGGVIYILGGTAAVSESMEAMLEGMNVKRLAGADRYETNLLILKEAGVLPGQEVLVCTGSNFADSLSASATGMPILLVNNASGTLSENQNAYLSALYTSYCVIGGEGAVSSGLEESLGAYGVTRRLAGTDRFETSVLVAEAFFDFPSSAVLAYAGNFPDGLCGGALAYGMKAPLILTTTHQTSQAAAYAKRAGIAQGMVLGGDGLISDSAVRWIFSMTAEQTIAVR